MSGSADGRDDGQRNGTVRVATERDGAVLRVRLSRADRRNAFDLPMAEQLADALTGLDAGVAVVLVLAEGEHFCVGGDVAAFAAADDPGAFVATLAAAFHRTIRAISAAAVPVVFGVRGWAAGAGLSLITHADLVVCGTSARFRPAYSAIGLTPDGGMSWTLPRLLGPARALDLLLTDGVLGAQEALAAGLVSRVVDDERVDAEAAALAARLATGPRAALAATRRLVRDGLATGLDLHLDAEAARISAAAAGPEGREGVRAFTERRDPDFTAPDPGGRG